MTLIISWRIFGFIAPASIIRIETKKESDQIYFLLLLEYMCRSDQNSLHRRGRFLNLFQNILNQYSSLFFTFRGIMNQVYPTGLVQCFVKVDQEAIVRGRHQYSGSVPEQMVRRTVPSGHRQ